MKPIIPITDPQFKYTDAANTDIRKRFDRVRKELGLKNKEAKNVVPIKQVK